MPAIKTLTDRIPLYKATLHALDEANQVSGSKTFLSFSCRVVLTLVLHSSPSPFSVRWAPELLLIPCVHLSFSRANSLIWSELTSPLQALLGVPTESLSDGSATPELYLKAGERREKACLALEARADEICWAGRVISDDRWDNAQSLVALTQLLICKLRCEDGWNGQRLMLR